MKYQLELNCLEDGRTFLNFWDANHGNDVVCEIVDGKLFLSPPEENEKGKKITLQKFIQLVEATNVV